MTKIYTGASMSLDGYISGPNVTGFEHLFEWMMNGDVAVETANPEMTMRLSETSAAHLRGMLERTGCLIVGRRLFDYTKGWGGKHTMGVPVVVLTHSVPDGWEQEGEWFTFVTEGGIEAAVETAKRIAGDKIVGVNGGEIASQCLNAGLLDEVWIDLVPVFSATECRSSRSSVTFPRCSMARSRCKRATASPISAIACAGPNPRADAGARS